MALKHLTTLTFTLLMSVRAFAAAPAAEAPGFHDGIYCPTIDLSDQFGSVRNQNNIGWCYANVAADLLTFYFRNQIPKGERASAAYVALAFNSSRNVSPLTEGGDIVPAFNASFARGICPNSGEIAMLHAGPQIDFKDKLQGLYDFKTEFDDGRFSPYYYDKFMAHEKQLIATKSTLFTAIPPQDLQNMLLTSTQDNFPITIADYMCRGHRVTLQGPLPIIDRQTKVDVTASGQPLNPVIHAVLSHHMPVAVGYSASFLLSKTYPAALEITRQTGFNNVPEQHASMIVGEHWDEPKHRCEWMIRNSWGDSHNYVNPDIAKDPKTSVVYVPKDYFETQVFEAAWFRTARPQ